MPTFTPRACQVEAHQWHGNLAALPLGFAAVVVLQGNRPPLVQTPYGAWTLLDGHWLVRGVDGRFEVLPDGPFQARWQAFADPVPSLAATGTLTLKGKKS